MYVTLFILIVVIWLDDQFQCGSNSSKTLPLFFRRFENQTKNDYSRRVLLADDNQFGSMN